MALDFNKNHYFFTLFFLGNIKIDFLGNFYFYFCYFKTASCGAFF